MLYSIHDSGIRKVPHGHFEGLVPRIHQSVLDGVPRIDPPCHKRGQDFRYRQLRDDQPPRRQPTEVVHAPVQHNDLLDVLHARGLVLEPERLRDALPGVLELVREVRGERHDGRGAGRGGVRREGELKKEWWLVPKRSGRLQLFQLGDAVGGLTTWFDPFMNI